jgi:hypothetical protein
VKVIPVEFVYSLPVPGPLYLQLQGIKERMPMEERHGVWSTSLDLPEGVHSYRFQIADLVSVNDPRRSIQKTIGGETWSVVQVTSDGPVWVARPVAKLGTVQLCRGISEAGLPLVAVEQVRLSDMPVVVWAGINHVFQDALLQVFLVRPDQKLAFGGEFVLDHLKASPNFDLRFWISVSLEPGSVMPGVWVFLAQLEGGPHAKKGIQVIA